MGEVYRGHDTCLQRDVAIKVLPTAFAAEAERRPRFERETQTVATLSHPNIVTIFDTDMHRLWTACSTAGRPRERRRHEESASGD